MNHMFFSCKLYKSLFSAYGFVRFVSYLFGAIFIFSGIAKLLSIQHFADEIAQYIDYYLGIPFLIELRKILAVGVCILEILIGILSIIKVQNVSLAITTTLLLLVFVYFTGYDYLFPAFGQGVSSCGCFGDLIRLTAGWSFAKSVFLLVLSVIYSYLCYCLQRDNNKL